MAHVLFVDDDFELRETFADVLGILGHTVRGARNGREGLACLLADKPDVIVSDVEMPILDCRGMASEITSHDDGLEDIPLVLVSAVRDLPHVADELGTPYYLAKPFSIDAVAGVLTRALSERTPPHPGAAQAAVSTTQGHVGACNESAGGRSDRAMLSYREQARRN